MKKYLRKLSSTCFDVAPVPVIVAVGGFTVALCLTVVALIVLAVILIIRRRRRK